MSTIYDRGQALAIRQLAPIGSSPEAKGQAVTLSYVIPGAYDENTQTTGDDVLVTLECSGVEKAIRAERVDGKSIQQGDSEFVLSPVTTAGADLALPADLPPQVILTFADGRKPAVVRMEPKRPSGLLVSVTLQLRS